MASPPLENFQRRVMASPTTKSAYLLAGELLQEPRSICRSGLAFGPPLQKKRMPLQIIFVIVLSRMCIYRIQ